MNRVIKFIVVHKTMSSIKTTAKQYFRESGKQKRAETFHCVIDRKGDVYRLKGINATCNNDHPQEANAYHIAYLGGIFSSGKKADTRSIQQANAIFEKIQELKNMFPDAVIIGAGAYFEDRNKACGFNPEKFYYFYRENSEMWLDMIGKKGKPLLLYTKWFPQVN